MAPKPQIQNRQLKRNSINKRRPPMATTTATNSNSIKRRTVATAVPITVTVLLIFLVLLLGILSISWRTIASSNLVSNNRNNSRKAPVFYGIRVVNEFPHDPTAFTQGLLYAGNGKLLESTGLYGRSSVRRVDLKTGRVEARHEMNRSVFGEGLTMLGDRLFQVTWLTKIGFIYDRNDLKEIKGFTHQMQDGWGLATDGKVLFGSDGTSTLYRFDPQHFKVIRKHIVKYNNYEVHNLNELEFINGEVWANVWQTDCIARISPEDGNVKGWILLPSLRQGLIAAGYNYIDVLNGIAWDADEKRLFVTGKLWPKLYEIEIHEAQEQFDGEAIKQLCLSS